MKKMVYKKMQIGKEVLDEGEYLGFKYMILSLSTHPCAYIFIDKENELCGKSYDDIHSMIDLKVHGGLTFSDNRITNVIEYSDKYKCDTLQRIKYDWIIGWDYTHLGDYNTMFSSSSDKKWTTKEIQNEVYMVINQLHEQLKYSKLALSRKDFIDKIIEEINEDCGFYGEVPYIVDKDTIIDYTLCINVEENMALEELDDEKFNLYCKYIDTVAEGEILDYIDECKHPYDPFREHCDADFYGI